jgi:hypothetical protein
VSLEAVAMYNMATPPLPSLAAGGGDEEDAGAGARDEAADVQERDLILALIVEAIRIEQHHGLGGSLESSDVAADTAVMMARCGQSRTKAVARDSEGHDEEEQEARGE